MTVDSNYATADERGHGHHNSSGFNNSHNVSVSTTNNNNNNNVGQIPDYQEYGTGSVMAGGSQTGLTQNTAPGNLAIAAINQNQAAAWANSSQNSGQMNIPNGQPIGTQSAKAQN